MSGSAFEAAVKLLAGRGKSRAGLGKALAQRGFPAAEVEAALDRCVELGYLDDAQRAGDLARELFADDRSLAFVAQKLESQGLDPTVAAEVAAEVGHDDRAAAARLLKSKRLSGVKAARLLASRGFPEEVVESLVAAPHPED